MGFKQLAEVRRTFEEKSNFDSTTRSYTLIPSKDQIELHFYEQTIDRGFEYVNVFYQRSVINQNQPGLRSWCLSLATHDLIETTELFDELAWKSLNQEFRENFSEGSICFRKQNGRGSGEKIWAHERGGQLLTTERGLELIWTFNDLRARATITKDQVPDCLAFMDVENCPELLFSMSNDEDQRWRDICRYFEIQGSITIEK
jgi:hypothetical protein